MNLTDSDTCLDVRGDLASGPDTWRVRITGLAGTRTEGGRCCGACGGV